MCRLFGWSSPTPRRALDLLGGDERHLVELSHLHADGWGAAWLADGRLERTREASAAHASAAFHPALAAAEGEAGLVHLRWATGNYACTLGNTHPFVDSDVLSHPVAFAHNGSVPVGEELLGLIDADLLPLAQGETDSERYFLALLSARRRGLDPVAAFGAVVDGLAGVAWPSLNALWLEPGLLVAVTAVQPEHRMASLEPDYYDLAWRTDADGATTVWSTGVRAPGGQLLANRHALVLTVGDSPQVHALPSTVSSAA